MSLRLCFKASFTFSMGLYGREAHSSENWWLNSGYECNDRSYRPWYWNSGCTAEFFGTLHEFWPKMHFRPSQSCPHSWGGGNTLLPLSFLILCSNYGLSGFALYLQPALVFLTFFPAKIEKKQTRKHPARCRTECRAGAQNSKHKAL